MRPYIYLCFLHFCFSLSGQVRLNEVSNHNEHTLTDGDGDTPDWLEVWIASGLNEEYYLSDDPVNLKKWKLPYSNVTVDTFLLILLSGKDYQNTYEIHSNFRLKESGDKLFLSNSVKLIDSVSIPFIQEDFSYQRNSDLSWSCTNFPSPGKLNNSKVATCNFIDFSINPNSGFYENNVEIKLSQKISSDIQLRYTIDGSVPTYSSTLLKFPLLFDSTVAFRVQAFQGDIPVSNVIDRVYFVREKKHTVPVVSIVLPPFELFSDSIGLFTFGKNAMPNHPYRGANFWSEREVPVSFDYFVNNKNVQSGKIDIGMYGGSGCRTQNMKAIKLLAKEKYDFPFFNYNFFSQKNQVHQFKRLVLRNSSNDFLNAHMRDGAVQRFVLENNFDFNAVGYEPCVLYINGKYWGFYNLREKIDEYFFLGNYGLNKDQIHLMEEDSTVLAGDPQAFDSLYRYCISHDLSSDENYKIVEELLDISSMMDYFIVETFFNNTDWPYNNIKYWKPKIGGKWKYILIDTDAALNAYTWSFHNVDLLGKILGPYGDQNKHVLILRALLQHKEARRYFINRYADLLNSICLPGILENSLEKTISILEPEMPQHYAKWGGSIHHWYDVLNNEIVEFARNRNHFAFDFLETNFSLKNKKSIIVNTIPAKSATIKLNSLSLYTFPWAGYYFPLNSIDVSAIPDKKFKFNYFLVDGDTIFQPNLSFLEINNVDSIIAVLEEVPSESLSKLFYKGSDIYFEWYQELKSNIDLLIYNCNGALIQRRTLDAVNGFNHLRLDMEDVVSGVYYLKVQGKAYPFVKM